MADRLVPLHLTIVRKSESGNFMVTDGDSMLWLSRRYLHNGESDEVGETSVFHVPEWLATKEGLV